MNLIRFKLFKNFTLIIGNISKKDLRTSVCNYELNNAVKSKKQCKKLEDFLEEFEPKIYYSSFIELQKLTIGYNSKSATLPKLKRKQEKELLKKESISPLPVYLKYLTENENPIQKNERSEENVEENITFPYNNATINLNEIEEVSSNGIVHNDNSNQIDEEIKSRYRIKNDQFWMTDYENYDDNDKSNIPDQNYGTADPTCLISSVPCGGCGALLHCRDSSIPGYVPSEIYRNYNARSDDLKSLICQRCHFLKYYNLALQVQVSQQYYPKILQTIQNSKKALVILMVDLLDFPCSIWPGIADLIGYNRPIVIVGNKIDLIPMDGKGFLSRVQKSLLNSAKESGFAMANIKHVALISAKTGFGVEELINKLHNIWEYKGT